jgi:hypothetical protein
VLLQGNGHSKSSKTRDRRRLYAKPNDVQDVGLLTKSPGCHALLVSSHPDEQSARRTGGKSKQPVLFIQSLATISPDDSLWQITCLSIAQSETRKPTHLANER